MYSLLHYAKLAVNGQTIVVWEELSPDSDDPRKLFLQTLGGVFEVYNGIVIYGKLQMHVFIICVLTFISRNKSRKLKCSYI